MTAMTTTSTPLPLAYSQAATLGEGLQWRDGRWWWTDIEAAQLHAWQPGTEAAQTFRLPDRLGCFAHARSGRMILGLAKRLCLGTLSGAEMSLQPLVGVDTTEPRTRINDGRTDRRGYFVFGTINEQAERRPIASFYQYSMQHGLRRLALPAVAIANSICFSLDGRTMYFCDTLSQLIQQCDYDAETAQVGNMRPFVRMEDKHAWPDGAVIDAEGCLWNAQWGAGRVLRYAPDGRELARYTATAPHTSCPHLGGERGDQLMVTTARQELSREQLAAHPLSGSLFGIPLDRPLGVPDTLFDDQ